MQRRAFLKHGGLAGVLAAGTAPAFAQGAGVKWRLTSSYPKSLDTLYGVSENVAKRVGELTSGKFQIQPFAAGEIVPGLQVLDAVQNGTVEAGSTSMYYYFGKNPTFAFATALPFGLNTRMQNAWWHFGGGKEIYNDFLKQFGVTAIAAGNTGGQMGGWYRKEIKGVADLKGLKMRIGGPGGVVLSKLGAVPQQIAGGDIYPALEKGTIDAAEWVGPYDDEKLGFAKVAKYYYSPGWWEGNSMTHVIVNQKQWDALPKEFQYAFECACHESDDLLVAKYDHLNPAGLRKVVSGGAQLRRFSNEVLQACYNASNEVYDEFSAKFPEFKKIYDVWSKYRAEENLWFNINEGAFDSFMYRASQVSKPAAKK
jgi:TRAP-type mannitol/chloroaromatic compound transport system substrate-binding protein